MNTRSRRAKLKNFRIILDSGSSSTIVMGKLTSNLKSKETAVTNWETQGGNFTTSKKVNIYFCLPEFSAAKIVTWKCHVYESTNDRYNIILGRDILIAPGLDLKFSQSIIIGGEGPYEGCLAPMVDIINYNITFVKDKTVKPEESFINTYVDEKFESDSATSSMRRMRIIIYAKCEKSNLNKVMT